MSNKDAIDKGRIAESLIDNGIFREAVDSLRKSLIDEWMSTAPGEHDYALKLQIQLIGNIENRLKRYVSEGRIAESERKRSIFGGR